MIAVAARAPHESLVRADGLYYEAALRQLDANEGRSAPVFNS